MKKQPHSEEHLRRIKYWQAPIPPVKPRKKELNTDLKIAFIGSERLYDGFRFEAELYLLSQETWKQTLTYIDVDFLLIEACIRTVTNDWAFAQSAKTDGNKELITVINFAKEKNIPTVFWNTQDHVYHELYKDISKEFDYTFCADLKEQQLLSNEKIYADLLLPSVQPALYNSFRENKYYDKLDIDVLFDGWADLFRFDEQLSVLKEIKKYGLKIIDSKKEIFKNKVSNTLGYKDQILGCVSEETKRMILKYSKSYITFNNTLQTAISQQWDALECAASKTNIIHQGELDENDIRSTFVTQTKNDDDLLLMLCSYKEDSLYRERLAHKAWRTVNTKHTYYHRVKQISNKLKIQHQDNVNKIASIITPTYRSDYITKAIENFKSQEYSNKELIIVYNGTDDIDENIQKTINQNEDILLISLPPEQSVGECLNYGHQKAVGDYFFRFDDDDEYGPNYVSDIMINLLAIDAKLFGKPFAYYQTEPNMQLYHLPNNRKKDCIVTTQELKEKVVNFSGNSIGGNKNFFLRNMYPEKNFNAVDFSLIFDMSEEINEGVLLDSFNLIANRRQDISTHTWRPQGDKIAKTAVMLAGMSQNDVLV